MRRVRRKPDSTSSSFPCATRSRENRVSVGCGEKWQVEMAMSYWSFLQAGLVMRCDLRVDIHKAHIAADPALKNDMVEVVEEVRTANAKWGDADVTEALGLFASAVG